VPFDSPDINLGDLLGDVGAGKVQLPDFQREWKWDNDRIASLLASLSLDYPIGVLMMLQVGGDNLRFKPRAVAGTQDGAMDPPDRLLLDGQQRITSLFQALKADKPTNTTDAKGKKLKRWYYLDIAEALNPEGDREEAIVPVPEDRLVKEDFGRKIVADYSSMEKECAAEMFPLSRAFDMGAVFEWQNQYIKTVLPHGETVS